MRPYQLATAAALILIAAVAMFDTRGGALPDTSGGAPGGLKGGWYPFWSAAFVLLAGVVVLYRTATLAQPAQGAFRDLSAVLAVAQLVLPMVIATYLMSDRLLGFYAATGVYVAYFARFTARYRWYWAVVAGVLVPLAVYLVFEVGFRATFPKSFLYPGLPF